MIQDIPYYDDISWEVGHILDKMWRNILSEYEDLEEDDLREIIKEQIQFFI